MLIDHARIIAWAFIAGALPLLAACSSSTQGDAAPGEKAGLDGIDLSVLGEQRVLFGHMSVGYNIMDGVADIMAGAGQPSALYVREVSAASEVDGPGLYHVRNGPNGDAAEKNDNFRALLEGEDLGSRLDTALVKFCYVDIRERTDIDSLFNRYAATVDELKEQFPSLAIVHATVPLTIHKRGGIRTRIRMLVKGDRENAQRNRFNDMLREKFDGVDPIYDIAAVESTRPDGSHESFTWKGRTWNALYPGYTSDGGHLNEAGRRRAAAELLRVLAGAVKEK